MTKSQAERKKLEFILNLRINSNHDPIPQYQRLFATRGRSFHSRSSLHLAQQPLQWIVTSRVVDGRSL
jgi:hypothetical protein